MISFTPSASRDAAGTVGLGSDYFATEAHYLSLAGRISAALSAGHLVLVTGDPAASPMLISEAIHNVTHGQYAVIGIPCGSGLSIEQLCRTGCEAATPGATAGAAAKSALGVPQPGPPLFIFHELERVSDQQIEQVCQAVTTRAAEGAAGVLVAGGDLLARLEELSLAPLKAALAARFRFDEVGEDESLDFLRHQLQTRRREDEVRGFPPIVSRGLLGLGVAALIGIGAFLALHQLHTAQQPFAEAGTGAYSVDRPPLAAAPRSAPRAAAAPAPASPAPVPEGLPQVAAPPAPPSTSVPQSEAEKRPSPADVAALVARGDGFLSAGDIASARLFYERAADAGDGAAALRMAVTFDPQFLAKAGVRGAPGDPVRAASWYRRARDLGEAAAAERLKNFDQPPR